MWFAEKFVSLLIEQHPWYRSPPSRSSCDLLKNSYLCLLNNTKSKIIPAISWVVICWKIRIFAYWTTPNPSADTWGVSLWFAEKFVSLLIEQHHESLRTSPTASCDLLKNSYLCLLNNTSSGSRCPGGAVVICWKIRIFAYWTTPRIVAHITHSELWFAEKFVSLLIEQHLFRFSMSWWSRCDLLKNSYLCLLNNTLDGDIPSAFSVVICWKIRIFAYWTTPKCTFCSLSVRLWFAEKFVSLLIEQHLRRA